MTGYKFVLTCPHDGGEVAHRNAAGSGTEALAVAACRTCGAEFVVTVHLRPMATQRQERDRLRQRAYRARVGA